MVEIVEHISNGNVRFTGTRQSSLTARSSLVVDSSPAVAIPKPILAINTQLILDQHNQVRHWYTDAVLLKCSTGMSSTFHNIKHVSVT